MIYLLFDKSCGTFENLDGFSTCILMNSIVVITISRWYIPKNIIIDLLTKS